MRRLALVTGGSSGIGLGIAQRLAPNFDLALAYGVDEAKAALAVEAIQSAHPDTKVHSYRGRLASEADCSTLYKKVVEDFDQAPAVLVNGAGRIADGLFLQADFETYRSVLDEHLVVTMALSQLALKAMYRERWGRIVNLSSISATYMKRGQTNYAAAKAGIEAFTKGLALEVAHRGVTVNAIAPGLIDTPMTRPLLDKMEAEGASLRDRVPAGRAGTADEVGALAAFLCTPDAAYITGTVITIDGGRSLGDTRS